MSIKQTRDSCRQRVVRDPCRRAAINSLISLAPIAATLVEIMVHRLLRIVLSKLLEEAHISNKTHSPTWRYGSTIWVWKPALKPSPIATSPQAQKASQQCRRQPRRRLWFRGIAQVMLRAGVGGVRAVGALQASWEEVKVPRSSIFCRKGAIRKFVAWRAWSERKKLHKQSKPCKVTLTMSFWRLSPNRAAIKFQTSAWLSLNSKR